ncbi:hypothetical protein Nepgr_002622 [Nepenthes gracilis]|uniref:Uncharacterized protein n=1 Tax=Nepenthes gracilis TaxID=150966 RepID=A0AAD3RYC8_NEPGR|nr:hypothetical protein Nepgr_002622 [Nepenthes gracilis]
MVMELTTARLGGHITAFHKVPSVRYFHRSNQNQINPISTSGRIGRCLHQLHQGHSSVGTKSGGLDWPARYVGAHYVEIIKPRETTTNIIPSEPNYRAATDNTKDSNTAIISARSQGSRISLWWRSNAYAAPSLCCSISQQHGINQGSSCIRSQQLH